MIIENMFMVGARTDNTYCLLAPPLPGRILSKNEALNLAAWLVACADDSENHKDFHEVLEAVEST